MLDTRLLTFLTLLEEKNYTKTANKLYITQPAVTHHIKSLEKDNSIQLFKDNKTFELTAAGNLLREYALAAKQQYSQFQNALQKHGDYSVANVALTPMASTCFEAEILVNLSKKNDVHVNFYDLNYSSIVTSLLEGTLDFAIIDHSFDSSLFDSFLFLTTNLILVCNPHGQYAEKERITREQLSVATMIFGNEESGLYQCTRNAFHQKNIRLKHNIILHANNIRWMMEQVLSYDGIGVMYQESAKPYLESGELKRIDLLNFQVSQNLYLIYNRRAFLDNSILSIIEELKKAMG